MATVEDCNRLENLMVSVIPKLRHAEPLYGFLPLEGSKYQRGNGLMVVGRAIGKGGWGPDDKPLPENQQDAEGIRHTCRNSTHGERGMEEKVSTRWHGLMSSGMTLAGPKPEGKITLRILHHSGA